MALLRCPDCGREVSDKAAACPGCGCPVTEMTCGISSEDIKPLLNALNAILHKKNIQSHAPNPAPAVFKTSNAQPQYAERKQEYYEKEVTGRSFNPSCLSVILGGAAFFIIPFATLYTELYLDASEAFGISFLVGAAIILLSGLIAYLKGPSTRIVKVPIQENIDHNRRIRRIEDEERAAADLDAPIRCPKCKSSQTSSNIRGYSLATGVIGSGKVYITCLKCGHRWKAGKQ